MGRTSCGKWTIPSRAKPIFQAATANFIPHSGSKVDPRTTTAGHCSSSPADGITQSPRRSPTDAQQYKHSDATTIMIDLPDRDHFLVIDSGWREIADACID